MPTLNMRGRDTSFSLIKLLMMSTTKKRFAINASWLAIGRIFQVGITFITTMLVARYLGPDKYGIITYTYSYVVIFSSFATLGLNDIVVKELLDKDNKKEEVLGTMILLKTISSTLTIGLIYIVITIMNDSSIVRTITILQSLSLLFQVFDSINYFYQASLLSQKFAAVNIIAYTLTAIFRIYGLLNSKDIQWFAFAVSLDFLVISILLISIYFKDGYKLSFSKPLVKKLLSKSYNYIFASVMIGIYSKADSIILEKMIDDAHVGYFAAATTICNAWPIVLQAIIDSASPIIIQLRNEDIEGYKKRFRQLFATIFYISVFVGILILLLSDFAIGLIYGSEYMPAASALKIVCWSTIFSYFGVARGIWMQCENKIKYEKPLYFLGAVSNVILNIVLIKLYGINGAALALTLTEFLTNFAYVYLLPQTRESAKLMLDGIILKGVFK